MAEEDTPQSPDRSLFALAPLGAEWRTILHASNQVVLYNPTSHALSIQRHHRSPTPHGIIKRTQDGRCPYCHRAFYADDSSEEEAELELVDEDVEDHPRSRVPNYFQLLQIANETGSVPPTPTRGRSTTPSRSRTPSPSPSPESANGSAEAPSFRADNMAEGYFKTFFQEECRLGMGANGSVYLCQHVLDGNPLGHFAVKKIAVGQSHSYLLNILREVRLLEKLHHPNIIQYHHAWLENSQFSSFGPRVPTLHMLMQWAEGGSLDDFIDVRLGRASPGRIAHLHAVSAPASGTSESSATSSPLSRSARIRAFRAMQRATPEERERLRREMNGEGNGRTQTDWKAVHLLSAEEVKSLFKDVVEGLAFLHDKSILHLDLKPGNVLLTWDEGRLIPRAMLSDFGTSQDMLNSRPRSGNTGTLEYASPESLPTSTGVLVQVDSKADMWSLGMILHKLLFFRLPYQHASDSPEKMNSRYDQREAMELLEKEVMQYPGFKSSTSLASVFASRRLPVAFLVLLESLLHVNPAARPSSERVLSALREGKLDPLPVGSKPRTPQQHSLVRASRRASFDERGRPSGPRDATPTELPLWTESDAGHEQSGAGEADKEPILGLPAPSEQPEHGRRQEFEYLKLRLWNQEYRLTRRTAWVAAKRTIKSLLLVWKVRSLSPLYSDRYANHDIVTCAMVLAFTDTWTERLTMSVILGAAHIALLRLAYWFH